MSMASAAAPMKSTNSQPANRNCKPHFGVLFPLTAAVMLVALVITVHWPVLSSQAQCFDDGEYVTQNRLVLNPGWYSARRFVSEVLNPSTVKGYYQPLPMISLMLDVATGGSAKDFRAFHQTNLALHVLNTVLLFLLLRQMFELVWPAVLTAALFGIHPMTVEPIAWLGERKTMLATFFSLACLLAYLRSTQARHRTWLAAAWLLYLAAMLSKPTAVPLCALLVLLDWWPLRRLSWRSVIEKTPFFALAACFAMISLLSQSRTAGIDTTSNFGPAKLALVIPYLISFYLTKMIWPVNLCSAYALPEPMSLGNPRVFVGLAMALLIAVALAFSLRRTRALVAGFL